MSGILSAIALVVFVCFAANVNNKTKELRNSGASEVEVNLTDGSVCGKVKGTWKCSSIFIIKIEGDDD